MSVEYILLLTFTVVLIVKAILGENGLPAGFQQAAPRLAARLERQIETGSGFNHMSRQNGLSEPVVWTTPAQKMDQPQ